MKFLQKYLIILFLFLLPTQLAIHFWPSWAFIFGIRIDLLAPSVYLTDIFVLILLTISVLEHRFALVKKNERHKFPIFIGLCLVILNTLLSISPFETFYKWLKVTEVIGLIFCFKGNKSIKTEEIVGSLFYSSVFFSIVGIAQFFKGGTLGGVFHYLGERTFNTSTPGIALVNLFNGEHLRAYSVFPHPNSLAGYLGVILILVTLSGKIKRNTTNYIGLILILFCFILTFSLSAYLGILVTYTLFILLNNTKSQKIILNCFLLISILSSLLLPIVSLKIPNILPGVNESVSQRLEFAYISGKVISNNFLLGSGLGTFIFNIPKYNIETSSLWHLQPVHNIYLLVFSEVGLVGILLCTYLIDRVLTSMNFKKNSHLGLSLLFILFTGLFDHYSLTLQQNTLLLSLLISMSLRYHNGYEK